MIFDFVCVLNGFELKYISQKLEYILKTGTRKLKIDNQFHVGWIEFFLKHWAAVFVLERIHWFWNADHFWGDKKRYIYSRYNWIYNNYDSWSMSHTVESIIWSPKTINLYILFDTVWFTVWLEYRSDLTFFLELSQGS